MVSNGGNIIVSGKRRLAIVFFALLAALFACVLLSEPVWAQEKQQEQRVSEAQKSRIERLSDAQAQEQFARAAQTSNAAGDLAGEAATASDDAADMGTEVDRIVIEGADNCRVASDATITFQETTGGEEVGVVANGDGAIIDPGTRRLVITGDPSGDIVFVAGDLDPGPLEVLSSSGIDCNGDNNDGFEDELLLLLLLELLEDNNDGDDEDDGDGDNGDDGDGAGNDGDGDDEDEDGDEGDLDGDTNGDGILSQEEQYQDAENDLNDSEITDGEITNGNGFDDDGSGVSAQSGEDGAEASTPGAVARSGGDPDEQEPVAGPQGDVEDEIETEGPLPETGGASVAAGTSLALVVFGVSLLALRLVSGWRGRRT